MTTEAEIEAAAKAIDDLKLTFRAGGTDIPLYLGAMTRIIAITALHAAEDVRLAEKPTWGHVPEGFEMRINDGDWITKAAKVEHGDRIEIRKIT